VPAVRARHGRAPRGSLEGGAGCAGDGLIRLLALLAIVAAACAAAQSFAQSFAQLAADGGPSRHERLVNAAKKEGSLTLYTSNAAPTIKVLGADFEKRYGVRVNVWRASSVKVLQRALAEKAANRWDFDAVSASSPELEALFREGLLQEVSSALHAEMLEGTVPAHRGWAPQFINVFVQAYNTNAVGKRDLPKRWSDLLEPKWKGRLGVEAKAGEWYCALVKSPGGANTGELLRQIGARNGWSVRSGNSVLANMVVSGEVPLALAVYGHMIDEAKRRGAPVEWLALEPVIARSNGIGVSRRPPHPNAALLFYEYALGEAQPLMLKMDYVSPVKALASGLRGAKIVFVDPGADAAEVERCDNAYEALIKNKTRADK
jgi:iron(III) transport system substrate-binding protein